MSETTDIDVSGLSAAASGGDPLWDDWDVPPRVPDVPVLHLDGFDGPMDQLLDLVERKRIDLARMSPLAIVDQFVSALNLLTDRVPLDRRAGWVTLAARLLLLRSRVMFPASPEVAAEAERAVVAEVQRLEDRAAMRAAAAWLEARPQFGRDVFARPAPKRDPRTESYMALMEACLAVLQGGLAAGEGEESELVYRPIV